MFITKIFGFIALAVVGASAQSSTTATSPSTTSAPTPDPCILGCVGPAAISNGCVSFTNLSCVCTSTAFQMAAGACLTANCTPADVQSAMALSKMECANFMTTTATTAASSTAKPATSSSAAALGNDVRFGMQGMVAAAIAVVGAVVGGVMII